jgi:hypothetical protein
VKISQIADRRRGECISVGLLIITAALSGCDKTAPGRSPSRTSSPASPMLFVDRAAKDGLNYRWTIPGKRPLNILQTIGNGCAFLDYDNDGNLDILLVGPKLALYKGDGDGHFADVTHQTGLDKLSGHFLGCAVGDYDSDGFDDIYISGYRTGILLHNEGGKSFRDVTQSARLKPQPWGTSCSWVETIPGSGRLDLFVCNYADFGTDPKKYPQLCEDNGKLTSCAPRVYAALRDTLFQNDGQGRFSDATRSSGVIGTTGKGLGIAAAPLDLSRRPFIAIADDEVPGDLLKPSPNGGSPVYTNIGAASGTAFDRDGNIHGGMGIDWADYDNDGKLDLFVTTFLGEAKSLYHNDGGALFSDSSYDAGLGSATLTRLSFGCKFFDASNDGHLDLMIASGHIQDNAHDLDSGTTYRQATQFFQNVNGHFVDLSASSGADLQRPIVGRGLAVGDFDNDGRVDALVVDSEGAPLLLHNESAPVGHWLSLRLVGVKSNRDGYGAIVRVTARGATQTLLCHADGSYLSSSDRRVHIGLCAAQQADKIEITWPSGRVDTLHSVAADRVLDVREGAAAR